MAFFAFHSPFSAEDRARRRRLVLSDTLALLTLFAITSVLAVLTNYFYQSYASHQAELARRWLVRGEADLSSNKPQAAIDALRSALALAPGRRSIEIALAEALASAGQVQEATVYFNTLAESEPGNGMIQLQLARLAARQGNDAQALEHYQRAIYGTWEGDGYLRRREVRLELVHFLIGRQLYAQARNELLVASGNASEHDTGVQLEIARLMEDAQDPRDALQLYRSILQHQPSSLEGLEGAGRTAFHMGRYLMAKQYLERAMNHPAAAGKTDESRQQLRSLLRDSIHLLLLYPSSQLSPLNRDKRILADRQIAQERLASCALSRAATANGPAALSKAPAAARTRSSTLQSLASRLRHRSRPPAASAQPPKPPAPDPLQSLAARWQQQPSVITLSALERDPDLAQAQIQLIYDTEIITSQVCGVPTGDDALLLEIALAPNAVEQE